MKFQAIIILLCTFCYFWAAGQKLHKDTATFSDEFNYTGLPDTSKWKTSYPWGGPVYGPDTPAVLTTLDGSNAIVHNGYLSLTIRRRDTMARVLFKKRSDTLAGPARFNFHYTCGAISTLQKMGYGYYEARIRMPDSYYRQLFGSYFNGAFWQYDRSRDKDIDWAELDYCEIVTDNSGDNRYTCDAHMVQPFGENDSLLANRRTVDPLESPAHFMNAKMDTCADYADYYQRYERNYLRFNRGWHIIGTEWSPGGVKFYLDHVLWLTIKPDYVYSYYDELDCVRKSMCPVQSLSIPMPVIFDFMCTGGQPSACGPSQISMDVDYVRYYQMPGK